MGDKTAFDESIIPPGLLRTALGDESFWRVGLIVVRSPLHRRKIMFVLGPQVPWCTGCGHDLMEVAAAGARPLRVGHCLDCGLSWQIHRVPEA